MLDSMFLKIPKSSSVIFTVNTHVYITINQPAGTRPIHPGGTFTSTLRAGSFNSVKSSVFDFTVFIPHGANYDYRIPFAFTHVISEVPARKDEYEAFVSFRGTEAPPDTVQLKQYCALVVPE